MKKRKKRDNLWDYNILYNPLSIWILILASLMFALAMQFNVSFNTTTFEKIIYTLINMKNLNKTIESLALPILKVSSSFVIVLCIIIIPLIFNFIFRKNIYINLFKKKLLVFPINVKYWSVTFLGISFIFLLITLNVHNFILNNINYTNLYEDYYVEYTKDLVEFPEEKRNLITIYVESFENSVFSKENGGINEVSYMPNLEKLTKEHLNFSNNERIGGFRQLSGTAWTAASLVGQTSGVPIYIRTKNSDNRYLEGAVSIGEVLEDNGYKNYFLLGSDSGFAERKNYFLEHGNYKINDYISAIDNKLISEDYYVWWGYEDRKLYTYAKDMLLDISKKDEPFNFSMLTADTHFYDGYTDLNCARMFNSNYANSYYCTDSMLFSFINWLKKQDFYEDTTIVITGDHLTMREDFFKSPKNYNRTIYNLFINSAVDTENTKNRDFTAFDMYPTTLAAMGVDIKGDKIALGTNLFSDEKTLMEELGVNDYTKEVAKMSKYYKEEIIQKK